MFTRTRYYLATASGAHPSAAEASINTDLGPSTFNPSLGSAQARPSTPSLSKRRIGEDAWPEPACPAPKRLVQHRPVPEPTRGPAASVDELTFEVLTLHSQKAIDPKYFKQIHEVIGDHAAILPEDSECEVPDTRVHHKGSLSCGRRQLPHKKKRSRTCSAHRAQEAVMLDAQCEAFK